MDRGVRLLKCQIICSSTRIRQATACSNSFLVDPRHDCIKQFRHQESADGKHRQRHLDESNRQENLGQASFDDGIRGSNSVKDAQTILSRRQPSGAPCWTQKDRDGCVTRTGWRIQSRFETKTRRWMQAGTFILVDVEKESERNTLRTCWWMRIQNRTTHNSAGIRRISAAPMSSGVAVTAKTAASSGVRAVKATARSSRSGAVAAEPQRQSGGSISLKQEISRTEAYAIPLMMSDSDDDEMPGEANQWCKLLLLFYHHNIGPKLAKIMGNITAMRISEHAVSQSSSGPRSGKTIDESMVDIPEGCARMSCCQCEQPTDVNQWGVNSRTFFAINLSRKIAWRFRRRVRNFTCHLLLHSACFVHHCGACQLRPTWLVRLCRDTFHSSICAHKTNTIHVVNREDDLKIKWLLLFYAGQKLCMLTSPLVCHPGNHV